MCKVLNNDGDVDDDQFINLFLNYNLFLRNSLLVHVSLPQILGTNGLVVVVCCISQL